MAFFQDSQKHLRCRSIVTSIVNHLLTYNDKIYVSKIYPSQLIFEGGANTGGLYSVCFWVYILGGVYKLDFTVFLVLMQYFSDKFGVKKI